MRHLKESLAIVLLLLAGPVMAQSLAGSVVGSATDEQGGALPGVNVTLSGKTGNRTAVTDAAGNYRFLAVDPGTYSVQADLVGFQSKKQEGIVVNISRQYTADMTLKVAAQTETLEVIGEAPVVDTASSATDQRLSQDMLFNLPIRPTNAAVNLLNFVPGINSGSAFGGDSDTGNALLLDGVDTRDPEGGSAWTFFNFNIVEEVNVSGLGAPAEYGSFTGAVVNTITRSGGNQFGGLFDVIYTRNSLASDNITDEITTANPALAQAGTTKKLIDMTAQFSGPIIKDKLFFFASAERFKFTEDPSGPRTIRDEVSPRFNVKLTYNPSPNDNFTGTFQADDYNVIGRPGVSALLATDELTNEEDAPELLWLAQWRHLFGSKTFSEIKYTGWTGYFDLNPAVERPGHFDAGTGLFSQSQGWFAYYDRGRHQVNATVSHYAEGFGKHDLKFGVEVERSRVRNRYGYVNDIFYYDNAASYPVGEYYAYNYGYDIEGKNQRESLFAQDSWKVTDRLTINPGLRFDFVRGVSPKEDNKKVYDTKNLAPRIGFAYDLTGDSKTVLKGHYGQYYEGGFFLTYSAGTPGVEDFVLFFADPEGSVVGPDGRRFSEVDRSPTPIYEVDPDIKHPRVDEFTLGLERALSKDIRLSLTGIYREDKNLQGSVSPSARWAEISLANELNSTPATAYRWVNRPDSEDDLLLTNPDGFAYRDAAGNVLGTAKAYRKYKGLMAVLNKRFSDRWQAQLSYVLSKSEGTVDNDGFNSFGADSQFETPTRALVNVDGPLTNDRTHEIKVYATYQVPTIEVGVNLAFRSVSGQTFTPFQQYSSSQINFVSSSMGRRVRLEPRGSRREERENIVDLRLEKIFKIGSGKERIALYADITNLFNESTITSVLTRVPSTAIAGIDDPVLFGAPGSVIKPRQAILGARWSF